MTDDQTLVLYSGHPLGLFPSHRDAPRVVVTNGMVIPNYSSGHDYDRMSALGVTLVLAIGVTYGSFLFVSRDWIWLLIALLSAMALLGVVARSHQAAHAGAGFLCQF